VYFRQDHALSDVPAPIREQSTPQSPQFGFAFGAVLHPVSPEQ
jgi:hypothetical protein